MKGEEIEEQGSKREREMMGREKRKKEMRESESRRIRSTSTAVAVAVAVAAAADHLCCVAVSTAQPTLVDVPCLFLFSFSGFSPSSSSLSRFSLAYFPEPFAVGRERE